MKYIIIISVVFLAACAPVTKETLRQDPAYISVFSVNQPYQEVFDRLLKKSRSCYLDKPTSAQLTLVGNRNNGDRTANITLESVYAMAEHDVLLMLDIQYEQDDQTKVRVYASNKRDKRKVDIIEEWVSDLRNQIGCA